MRLTPGLSTALLALAISSADSLAQQTAPAHAPRPGVVDGEVTDTALVPLTGATISILGSNIRVTTGDNGRFRISALPPGEYILLAARLGFEPVSERVVLADADTQRVALTLERNVTTLGTVVIKAPPVPARLLEFEQRRLNHEATASFNRDDILKVNPVETWQMLSRVSAVKLIDFGGTKKYAASARPALNFSGKGICPLRVMVDGVMMATADTAPFDLSLLPPPDQIHGIEVFAGPSSIPVKYGGSGEGKWCGLIAIWTR